MNGILNAEAGMEAHFDSAGWAFSNGTYSERRQTAVSLHPDLWVRFAMVGVC
jgi:hypothetical protein